MVPEPQHTWWPGWQRPHAMVSATACPGRSHLLNVPAAIPAPSVEGQAIGEKIEGEQEVNQQEMEGRTGQHSTCDPISPLPRQRVSPHFFQHT